MRVALVWVLLMGVEVVHGIARTLWLVPRVGDFRSRQIGVLTGSLLVLLTASLTIRWLRIRDTGKLLATGVLWAALTLAFELGLGRSLGASWSRIAEDYDLRRGGLMPLGLAVMVFAPLAAARLRSQVLPMPRERRRFPIQKESR